jgi:hypothetical protein
MGRIVELKRKQRTVPKVALQYWEIDDVEYPNPKDLITLSP